MIVTMCTGLGNTLYRSGCLCGRKVTPFFFFFYLGSDIIYNVLQLIEKPAASFNAGSRRETVVTNTFPALDPNMSVGNDQRETYENLWTF